MRNHNNDTIKMSNTELQHINPHSYGHQRFFPVLLGCSTGGLGAHSAGCWFSLPHLIFNWLNFLCTKLYNHTHSTRPRSRLYSDIPRPDVPVIYTGAFPILTARPGRRSIYNIISIIYNINFINVTPCHNIR